MSKTIWGSIMGVCIAAIIADFIPPPGIWKWVIGGVALVILIFAFFMWCISPTSEALRRKQQCARVLSEASRLLKSPSQLEPYQALFSAGAADLETNDQLVCVAGKLSEYHKQHPLGWMEPYVYEDEWLSFFQELKHHPEFKFDRDDDYLRAVIDWATRHNRGTQEAIFRKIANEMSAGQELPQDSKHDHSAPLPLPE